MQVQVSREVIKIIIIQSHEKIITMSEAGINKNGH